MCGWYIYIYTAWWWLVAINFLFSHDYWVDVIIPTDEVIFFRGVKKPPTRWWWTHNPLAIFWWLSPKKLCVFSSLEIWHLRPPKVRHGLWTFGHVETDSEIGFDRRVSPEIRFRQTELGEWQGPGQSCSFWSSKMALESPIGCDDDSHQNASINGGLSI